MMKTHDICKGIKKDPVLSLLVPQISACSIPIPLVSRGTPLLGFFFYLVDGEAGADKNIHPPLAKTSTDKNSGKVVDFSFAPHFWLEGHTRHTVLGVFPGPQLRGLSVSEVDELLSEYYQLTDSLLKEAITTGSIAKGGCHSRWLDAFHKVKENGLDDYYRLFQKEIVEINTLDGERYVEKNEASEPERPPAPLNDTKLHSSFPLKASHPGKLSKVMTRIQSLITKTGQHRLLADWRSIYSRMNSPRFSVAVVGEFNRGKSTLINRILGEKILHVGDTPTTSILTRITYGSERVLYHIQEDNTRQKLEWDQDIIESFVVDEAGADPKGVLQIELPHQFLKDNSIQLLDTPGVGDLSSERTEIAMAAIAGCDATLIAVDATLPLSLTEKAFVEDHIFSKKIPRVAIVLTRLDQVQASDRKQVIDFVEEERKKWAPESSLWSAHERPHLTDESYVKIAGPDKIGGELAKWSSDPNHYRLREIQAAAQMTDLVKGLRSLLDTQLQAIKEGQQTKEKDLDRALHDLERRKMLWEDLRFKMDDREQSAEKYLEEHILSEQKPITEALVFALNKSINPKEWWETDFPYTLKTRIQQLSKLIDGKLQQVLLKDVSWLDGQAKELFSVRLGSEKANKILLFPTEEISPGMAEITDIAQVRWFARFGIAAIAMAGICFNPVLMAASIMSGLATEKILSGKIKEQRKRLSHVLKRVVDDIVSQTLDEGRMNMRKYYKTMLNKTKENESRWNVSCVQAIKKSHSAKPQEIDKLEYSIGVADVIIAELSEII